MSTPASAPVRYSESIREYRSSTRNMMLSIRVIRGFLTDALVGRLRAVSPLPEPRNQRPTVLRFDRMAMPNTNDPLARHWDRPQLGRAVETSGRQPFSVRRERDMPDGAG